MTIHELANFTGISIKTLHYYDKIDLLKPYCIAPNGYRQYNEDSLKRLQQIMFYKEMDLPLKKIKTILAQPEYDQVAAIRDQKDLLIAKKNRIAKLINLMEQILEGNNTMDFSVFKHNELEEVMRSRFLKLDADYQQSIIDRYGSIDAFLELISKDYSKIEASAVKYYGSMEKYIESLEQSPLPREGTGKLQLNLDRLVKEISAHKEEAIEKPEVQALVEEWKVTAKALFQVEDISEIFRPIYHGYMNSKEIIKILDEMYGEGSTVFVGRAMEYNDNQPDTPVV